jgi:hypothetical protein
LVWFTATWQDGKGTETQKVLELIIITAIEEVKILQVGFVTNKCIFFLVGRKSN